MAKKKIKRQATYKQMAFETAVRNPERYKGILTAISPYINKVLNDEKGVCKITDKHDLKEVNNKFSLVKNIELIKLLNTELLEL